DRAVHSFPTRRSSDLPRAGIFVAAGYAWAQKAWSQDATRYVGYVSVTGESMGTYAWTERFAARSPYPRSAFSRSSSSAGLTRCRSEEHTSELQSRENL